jgi:hypothetical protein
MKRVIIKEFDCLFITVPNEASQFEFINKDAKYFTYYYGNNGRQYLKLDNGTLSRWTHVGEITKDSIGFDTEPFVEKIHVEIAPSPMNDFAGGFDYKYVNYLKRGDYAGWSGDTGYFVNKDRSFRSLMHSIGLHFKNPYSFLNMNKHTIEEISNNQILLEQWQKAENTLIKDAKIELLTRNTTECKARDCFR